MDGSRRSAHGNTYFSGFGVVKRIVFFDTLLENLAPKEIEAVLAHEIGHFKLKHIVKRIVVMFAASLAFLALLGYLKTADLVLYRPWLRAVAGGRQRRRGFAAVRNDPTGFLLPNVAADFAWLAQARI